MCAVVCQRRSYSTFLTLMAWLLTVQDPLLLDSGEREVGRTRAGGEREIVRRFARQTKIDATKADPQMVVINQALSCSSIYEELASDL